MSTLLLRNYSSERLLEMNVQAIRAGPGDNVTAGRQR